MDEAYTVGIRLALEDGVSSAIANLSKEMAVVERAIAAGAIGLGRLRVLGTELHQPFAEPPRNAQPPVPTPVAVDTTEPISTRTTAPMPTTPFATTPATPAQRDHTLGSMPSASRNVAPVVQVVPMTMAAAPMMIETPTAAPQSRITPAPEKPATRAASNIGQLMPARRENSLLAFAPVPTTPRSAAPEPLPADPSPQEMRYPGMVSDSAAPPATNPAPTTPAATQPDQAGTLGPTRGDVFLDGARMGRWIAERLAREAVRPQGGSTGFDGRMGPAWPGTMQGFA